MAQPTNFDEKKTNINGKDNSKENKNTFSPNKNSNNNGKKGNTKPKHTKCGQDPTFYASDDSMINAIASYPWLASLDEMRFVESPITSKKRFLTPSVMVLPYRQSFGSTNIDGDDYINKAADAFYNSIVQGYTGSVPFAAADAFQFVLGAGDIVIKILEGIRAYGMLRYFKQFNAGAPYTIFAGLGFNYDSIRDASEDFRSALNIRIKQFNAKFAIPKDFKLISKWIWNVSHIWKDDNIISKSGLYIFRPIGGFQLDESSITTGTAIRYQSTLRPGVSDVNGETVSTYFANLDSMIDKFVSNQDANTIFGAIRRVYDESQLLSLSEVPFNYSLEPEYSTEVLEFIHNIQSVNAQPDLNRNIGYEIPRTLIIGNTLATEFNEVGNYAIYQDERELLHSHPVIAYDAGAVETIISSAESVYFDVLSETAPSSGMMLDIIGFKTLTKSETKQLYPSRTAVAASLYTDLICRTEIYLVPRVIFNSGTNAVSQYEVNSKAIYQYFSSVVDKDDLFSIGMKLQFNFSPLSYMTNFDNFVSVSDVKGQIVPIGERCNFNFIARSAITQSLAKSFYQLYAIPVAKKTVAR